MRIDLEGEGEAGCYTFKIFGNQDWTQTMITDLSVVAAALVKIVVQSMRLACHMIMRAFYIQKLMKISV